METIVFAYATFPRTETHAHLPAYICACLSLTLWSGYRHGCVTDTHRKRVWSSGYDARFTRERSRVRSPLPVRFLFFHLLTLLHLIVADLLSWAQ